MNVSQQINHINENNYDDDITITDVAKGYFLAVTSITLPEGSATREVTVQLLPLEQAPGGTRTTNTGLFIRKAGEDQIKVTVQQDGNTLAENTTSYS